MNITDIRNNFPYLSNEIIYFNHASSGPISSMVLNRLSDLLKEKSENNLDDYTSFLKVVEETTSLSIVEEKPIVQEKPKRKARFERGSTEAKEHMKKLREIKAQKSFNGCCLKKKIILIFFYYYKKTIIKQIW